MDNDRGTGRTSQQLKFAPQGAIFIWCNDRLDYPKCLIGRHWINRPDIKIVAPSWLDDGWRGQRFTGIVIDHAAQLSSRHQALLREAQTRVQRGNNG
jgi:hypothetical protein